MKFEKIDEFLNKAGFMFIKEGKGFGLAEGRLAYLYQKNISGSKPQMIQLSVLKENKENIQLIYTNNVPVHIRDSITNILNDKAMKEEPVVNFGF